MSEDLSIDEKIDDEKEQTPNESQDVDVETANESVEITSEENSCGTEASETNTGTGKEIDNFCKPVQPDYVLVTMEDENSPSKKIVGGPKVQDLIQKFNNGERTAESQATNASYKSEYGVGKIGHIHQDKFK